MASMAECNAGIAPSRPLGRWDSAFMVEPRGICDSEGTVWLESCEEGIFAAVIKKIVRRGSATTIEALPAFGQSDPSTCVCVLFYYTPISSVARGVPYLLQGMFKCGVLPNGLLPLGIGTGEPVLVHPLFAWCPGDEIRVCRWLWNPRPPCQVKRLRGFISRDTPMLSTDVAVRLL